MSSLHKEPLSKSLDEAHDEYQRMQLSLLFYRPRGLVLAAIRAAYHDSTWDWEKCDGCTGVSELHFPKGYRFPPCVMHDHKCELARRAPTWRDHCNARAHGDELFLLANQDYCVNPARCILRYHGVRLYWLFWRRWVERRARKRERRM